MGHGCSRRTPCESCRRARRTQASLAPGPRGRQLSREGSSRALSTPAPPSACKLGAVRKTPLYRFPRQEQPSELRRHQEALGQGWPSAQQGPFSCLPSALRMKPWAGTSLGASQPVGKGCALWVGGGLARWGLSWGQLKISPHAGGKKVYPTMGSGIKIPHCKSYSLNAYTLKVSKNVVINYVETIRDFQAQRTPPDPTLKAARNPVCVHSGGYGSV